MWSPTPSVGPEKTPNAQEVGNFSCAIPVVPFNRRRFSYRFNRLQPAHKRIPTLKKTPQMFHLSRNSNPHALSHLANRFYRRPQPQRAISVLAQIKPIHALINRHRRGQPARPSRKIAQYFRPAVPLHEFNSLDRLHSANQYASAHSLCFRRNIHAETRTISEINIGSARAPETENDSTASSHETHGHLRRRLDTPRSPQSSRSLDRQPIHAPKSSQSNTEPIRSYPEATPPAATS